MKLPLKKRNITKRQLEKDRHSRDDRKIIKAGKGGKIQIDGSNHKMGNLLNILIDRKSVKKVKDLGGYYF